MATIVKTQEMLEAFGEQEIAVIKSSAVAFFDSVESAEKAVESYQRLLGLTPSWFAYEMARLTWREGITEAVEQSGKSITDNALNVRWNVFSKKLGIDKPAKTDSADAVRKAEKRAEEKAKQAEQFAGMSVEDLKEKAKELLKTPTLAKIDEAKKYTKQAELLYKEQNKEEQEQKANLVKSVTAWAKEQSYIELYTFCENYQII